MAERTEEDWHIHFAGMGEKHVMALAKDWPAPLQGYAFRWLAKQDAERERAQKRRDRIGMWSLIAAVIAAVASVASIIVALA